MIGLLFGGTWINRNKNYSFTWLDQSQRQAPRVSIDEEDCLESPASWTTDDALLQGKSSPGLLNPTNAHAKWRTRELKLFGLSKTILTPNSRVFDGSQVSRIVKKVPFIQEVWYVGYEPTINKTRLMMVQVLGTHILGVPTRTRLHSRHSRRRNRPCRPQTCPTINSARTIFTHLLGGTNSAILPATSLRHDMDQQDILLHPHSRHNPVPRLAL